MKMNEKTDFINLLFTHMLNNFISALITIFFSGVASKETEEKTKRASWMRVFIYGVLTTIVGVFFYKTYQVATIVNMVEVLPMRTAFDENGISKDTIEGVSFYTRFSEDNTYSNRVNELVRSTFSKIISHGKYGGVEFGISSEVVSASEIEWDTEATEDDRQGIELPYGTMHAFGIHFMSSFVPRLIPVTPDMKSAWPKFKPTNSEFYLERHRATSFKNMPESYVNLIPGNYIKEDGKRTSLYEAFGDGICMAMTTCEIGVDPQIVENNRTYFTGELGGSIINKMNFLTAADISQFTYIFGVVSSLPVKEMQVVTDIPIEISSSDEFINQSAFGFYTTDGVSNELNKSLIPVHIKLPTLANLQLIRSLILTTIITALVSLFAVNLYYCIRRSAIRYRRKHAMSVSSLRQISKFRISVFRYAMNFILAVIGIVICVWAWMLLKDQPIHVDLKKLENHFELIIAAVVLLSLLIIVTLLYRYSHTPVSDEPDEEESEAPTIFVHESTQEEEMDKLFEGLPEDDMIEYEEAKDEDSNDEKGKAIES